MDWPEDAEPVYIISWSFRLVPEWMPDKNIPPVVSCGSVCYAFIALLSVLLITVFCTNSPAKFTSHFSSSNLIHCRRRDVKRENVKPPNRPLWKKWPGWGRNACFAGVNDGFWWKDRGAHLVVMPPPPSKKTGDSFDAPEDMCIFAFRKTNRTGTVPCETDCTTARIVQSRNSDRNDTKEAKFVCQACGFHVGRPESFFFHSAGGRCPGAPFANHQFL